MRSFTNCWRRKQQFKATSGAPYTGGELLISPASELDNFPWIMREIESLFVWDGPDSPLLHGQGAEQHINELAVIVPADLVNHHGVRRYLMPLDLRVQSSTSFRLSNLAAQRGAKRL